MARYTALTMALVIATACSRNGGARQVEAAAAPCAPLEGPLRASVAAEQLAGTYHLTVVATTGKAAGQQVEGRLSLEPTAAGLRYSLFPTQRRDTTIRYPLAGIADVAIAELGTANTGDLTSRDPMRPGVLMIEEPGSLIIRLGADANQRDVLRFDGGYTVLRIQRAEADYLAGTWESGTVTPRAAGHFCATREP